MNYEDKKIYKNRKIKSMKIEPGNQKKTQESFNIWRAFNFL